MTGLDFVVCISNAGYEASLDRGKRYRVLPDTEATAHRQVRIVDESGEDYLYPETCFSSAARLPSGVRPSGRPGGTLPERSEAASDRRTPGEVKAYNGRSEA